MAQEKFSKLTKQQEKNVLSAINSIRSIQNDHNVESAIHDKDSLIKLLAETLTEVISNHHTDYDRNKEIKNNNTTEVTNSGNSDVDIKIHIDLSSIAFAILYSLYASKQLTSEELEAAISRLENYKSK